MASGWWLVARVRARGLVGMRSRASGVAFPETVPALMLMPAFLYVLFIVLWTRDAGRAGAHPYHVTRGPPPDSGSTQPKPLSACRGASLLPSFRSMAELFDSEFLAKLEHLCLLSQRIFRGAFRAERRSRHIGSSLEFADYRNYVHGDDQRRIDWNVYGRLGRLFVKLFEEEEDLEVSILLDCSASMGWSSGGITKFDQACKIVAALAYIALANLDRVHLFSFDDELKVDSGLGRGKSQFHRLLKFLTGLKPTERATSLYPVIQRFTQQNRRRGLAVVVSDFFDLAGYETALNLLRFQRFEIQLVQVVDPGEIDPGIYGDFELEDCETGRRIEVNCNQAVRAALKAEVERFQESLRRYCLETRCGLLQAKTADPFEDLILRVLRERRIAV